ncbi:MAG: hypothetical protein HC895_03210 [Leptolyngbyaceae cyanobacterium SM1_3_5]|nr:hypothetical protein [Leptolyngbyaceae cyanobacterium SM1_3_5]
MDAAEPIANLRSAIESLIEAGARRIVVGNLPPLGQLPATRNRDSAVRLDRLAVSHNQQVAALVAELGQRDGATARLLDVNDLFERAIASLPLGTGEFNFTNVTEACLDAQRETICANPDQYLFWDGIHPTRAAHERISEVALSLSVAMSTTREFDRPAAPVLLGLGGLILGSLAAIAVAIRAKKR